MMHWSASFLWEASRTSNRHRHGAGFNGLIALVCGALGLAVGMAPPALAAPLFETHIFMGCGSCLNPTIRNFQLRDSGPNPVHLESTQQSAFPLQSPRGVLAGLVEGRASAIATRGALGLLAGSGLEAQAFDFGIGGATLVTQSRARFRLDDIIINFTGSGTAPAFLDVVLHLPVSGMLDLQERIAAISGGIDVNSRFNLQVSVLSQRFTGAIFRQHIHNLRAPPRLFVQETGILDPTGLDITGQDFLDGADFVLELPFHVPVGRFFPLEVNAFLSSSVAFRAGAPFEAIGVALWDLVSTISFPASGPVFTLPADFTVNAVSGRIVDNRWLGIDQVPPPGGTPVPEPSTLALLSGGLLGGLIVRALPRRRRAPSASASCT